MAVLSVACSDLLTNNKSGRGGLARLQIVPRFTEHDAAIFASLREFNLEVQSIRIVLTRPNSTDTLADTTVVLAAGQEEVAIELQVQLNATEELLNASMQMFSGTVLVFEGSTTVRARIGAPAVVSNPPELVPIWVGPGKTATRIALSPQDTTIPATALLTFSATAFDATNTPVNEPEYEARWQFVVIDSNLGSFTPGTREFVGSGTPGTARVMVFTPNLLRDTVTLTLVDRLPTRLRFAPGVVIVDRATTKAASTTVLAQDGTTMTGVTLNYTSRSPSIATVDNAGTISGVAKGQAVIVVTVPGTNPVVTDSLLAVVAEPGGPVVLTSVDRFRYPTDTTFTISVFVDMNTSTKKLGSTTIDVEWSPTQLQFISTANGTSGVSPTVNSTNASAGKITLAMADVVGFSGRVELLRITMKSGLTQSLGELRVTARELNASDYTDLLPLTVQVLQALSVR